MGAFSLIVVINLLNSDMSIGDVSSFQKALNELAERIVESALSEASLVLPQFSPVSSSSESMARSNEVIGSNSEEVTISKRKSGTIDVSELEHTVDSLNRKVQELLLQSQQSSHNYKAYYSVSKDSSTGNKTADDLTDSARKTQELVSHVSGVIDKIAERPSTTQGAAKPEKELDKTIEEAEYEELASRVQQIFERENSRVLDSSFNIGDAPLANSSYFTKGGPDGSFCWTDELLKSSSNIQDDAVTQTVTTVESTHTGSIDAETPRNLPNESIGSWTPRRLLVDEPHSSGVYGSKNTESLLKSVVHDQTSTTYQHDYSLNDTTAFITESVDTTMHVPSKSLNETSYFNGSVMSVVTESCNSSFFRDMNDSLYSPERDLRRADLRRSPSRKREKIRRSREDLSQCFDIDLAEDSQPNVLSSKPLSHFYPSSRSLVDKTRRELDNEKESSNPKLAQMWSKFPKARKGENRTGKTPNPKSSRDEIDCFSQLICNPVQYFARQWLEGVQEAANLTIVPESDIDSTFQNANWPRTNKNVDSKSWKSRKALAEEKFQADANQKNEVQQVTSSIVNHRAPNFDDKKANEVRFDTKTSRAVPRFVNQNKDQKDKKSGTKLKVSISETCNEDEVLVCESKRTVSVQTPRDLLLNYQVDGQFSDSAKEGRHRTALQANENIKTRSGVNHPQLPIEKDARNEHTSLTWFHSLSDKENQGEAEADGRPKLAGKKEDTPRGASQLTLQDAFLLNKADVLRKSRERQRMISIRTAERQMQEIYVHKRANYNMSTRGYHGLPSNRPNVKVVDAVQAQNAPRWASVVPIRDCNNARKKPITRSEMRLRTERLYQSLPEVKERDRLNKQSRQIQSNRIMLDSYKAKMKDQQRAKTSRSKTLVVRHY